MELQFASSSPWTQQFRLFNDDLELVVAQDKQNLADNLTALKNQVNGIILWLDCDREGECIAYECLKVIGTFRG